MRRVLEFCGVKNAASRVEAQNASATIFVATFILLHVTAVVAATCRRIERCALDARNCVAQRSVCIRVVGCEKENWRLKNVYKTLAANQSRRRRSLHTCRVHIDDRRRVCKSRRVRADASEQHKDGAERYLIVARREHLQTSCRFSCEQILFETFSV